jgi:hypothetical protein
MAEVMQEVLNKKKTIHNFNGGPSILPKTVFEQASKAVFLKWGIAPKSSRL